MLNITTQIKINASASKVWDCLLNFPQYGQWNPLIPYISGEPTIGSKIKIRITPPGLSASNYVLTILNVVKDREFRWLGHLFCPGFMDGNHVFVIETVSKECVLLTQAESFTGILIPFLAPFLKQNMRQGFEEMNLALKQYVETT